MNVWKLIGGFELPTVGLGTWTIGGEREPDYSNDKEFIEAIKFALEIGYTHIDTAEMYAGGHCEELVGRAVKNSDRRKLTIATKVTKGHLHYEDVLKAAQNSLERLGMNYIDLYYIHSPSTEIPLEETMKAINKLVEDGLVKHIGVSNFSADLFIKAQELSGNKIVANQIEYNLLTRERGENGYENKNMESRTVPYCQENDVLVVAERPIERGRLLEPNEVMDRLTEKYSKTRAQIAINWLVSQKNVVTIPKSQDKEHLKDNLEAGSWTMDSEDIEELRGAYETT